jgi:hypothetical protein
MLVKPRLVIGAAAVAGIVGLCIYWHFLPAVQSSARQSSGSPSNNSLATAQPVAQVPELITSPSAATSLRPATPQALEAASLAQEMRSAKNLRAFALSAWNKPEHGGRLYSTKVVNACAFAKTGDDLLRAAQPSVENVGVSDYLRALDALNHLQAQCGQFSDQELIDYSLSGKVPNAADANSDPLYGLAIAIGTARDAAQRASVREQVLKAADPMLLDDIGMRLSLYPGPDGRPALFFSGTWYPVADSPVLIGAYYLLPCAFGLSCDKDPSLLVACASGAGCYQSRFDRALREHAGGNTERYDAIMALYGELTAAVRARDVSRFVPR